ncbi:DUF5642 family protein [Mycolicibacterium rutilum]|uniref:DUF5642 family protein n=1 Tax=Mycolicibacterium rutilum TaxID=370526 RepID=UPI0012FFBE24|nr:DUF5642 family protein [Mycolicibacterium rutilum]
MKLVSRFAPAIVVTAVLAGCSTPAPETPNLAGLGTLSGDFPPGLTPSEPWSGPKEVDPRWAHLVGDTVNYGDEFTVDPAQCRPLLKPVEAQAGAIRAGIGAGGPQPPLLSVSAVDPIAVPVPVPDSGCNRVKFTVGDAVPDGTAVRLDAPVFDGATTYGLRIDHGGVVEYFYTAILDGRTYVQVTARMAPDFQAEPLLPDLLTKAVAAIRSPN